MQAAVSEGWAQANSWLIEIILKVGWDRTKQSKSLFKPTQICLYLYRIVNWVLKDFRLLPYWLMFQIFLLSVLQSCLLPVLIKCSLHGSTTQAQSAAWMERPWELSSASCLEPAPQRDLGTAAWPWKGSVHSPRAPGETGAGEEGGETLSSPLLLPKSSMSTNTAVTFCLYSPWSREMKRNYSSSREMKLNWEGGRREPCPVLAGLQGQAGAAQLGCHQLTSEGSCSWQQLFLGQEGQEAASIPICQSCPKLH